MCYVVVTKQCHKEVKGTLPLCRFSVTKFTFTTFLEELLCSSYTLLQSICTAFNLEKKAGKVATKMLYIVSLCDIINVCNCILSFDGTFAEMLNCWYHFPLFDFNCVLCFIWAISCYKSLWWYDLISIHCSHHVMTSSRLGGISKPFWLWEIQTQHPPSKGVFNTHLDIAQLKV